MYTRDGDRVRLDISVEDYEAVLMLLGMAAGEASREYGNRSRQFRAHLRLVNRINEGNAEFTPYEVSDEDAPGA